MGDDARARARPGELREFGSGLRLGLRLEP